MLLPSERRIRNSTILTFNSWGSPCARGSARCRCWPRSQSACRSRSIRQQWPSAPERTRTPPASADATGGAQRGCGGRVGRGWGRGRGAGGRGEGPRARRRWGTNAGGSGVHGGNRAWLGSVVSLVSELTHRRARCVTARPVVRRSAPWPSIAWVMPPREVLSSHQPSLSSAESAIGIGIGDRRSSESSAEEPRLLGSGSPQLLVRSAPGAGRRASPLWAERSGAYRTVCVGTFAGAGSRSWDGGKPQHLNQSLLPATRWSVRRAAVPSCWACAD